MAIFPTLPSLALLFLLEILLLPSASAHRAFNPYAPGVIAAAAAATPVQLPPLVLNFTSSLFSALHGASNGGNGGGGGVFVDEVTGENPQIIALKEQQQKPPPPPLLPISEFIDIPPNPDPVLEHRRRFLVNMTRHAWAAYANASWGEAELHPLSSSSKNSTLESSETPKSGKSIFAALSTLWVMGLTEEFTAGVDWLDRKMNSTLVVEEGLWEVPGALLSLYALTGNGFFLTKARGLAEKFKVEENNNLWGYSRLWTATRLEYRYLSDLTSSPRFIKQVAKIEKLLNNGTSSSSSSSSSSTTIEHDQIRLEQSTGNSLMLLAKAYLQSGGSLHSKTLKRELYDVLDRLISSGYIGSLEHSPDHLVTIRMSPSRPTMYSWHCLLGGVLSLAGELLPEVHHLKTGWATVDELHHRRLLLRAEHLLQLGANLTESCHRVAASTPTGLPFGQFKLVVNETMISKGNSSSSSAEKAGELPTHKPKLTIFGNGGYWLSSQLAETYFLLFRLTGQRRYQDYAWQLAQAINRHAKVTSGPGLKGGGFAEVAKVDRLPVERFLDRQPAEFLSATLKYLYLTFTPAHFISLKQWVLNAQGHPLPICGRNWAYPGGVCGGSASGAKHEEIAIV